MTRSFVMALFLGAVLLVAGCTGPVVDPLGPSDLDAAVSAIGDAGETVALALESDAALLAMAVPCGWFTSLPLPLAAAPSVVIVHEPLPRGIYECNQMTYEWDYVGPSGNLEYRWSFLDASDALRNAILVVDWGTTDDVGDGVGGTVEVPTDDMSVTLTIDGAAGGQFDIELSWYADDACPAGVMSPTGGLIDGSIGIDATLALNEVGFTLTDDAFDTSGEIVATAGANAIGIDWDIGVGIDLTRGPDCFIDDVEAIDGSVAVAVFATDAGTTTRLALSFGFADIVTGEFGGLESVAISAGQLRLNGTPVVTFAGLLNDANENGIPGDVLNLTFADGTTMTLEAYLEEYVIETAAIVRRALSLLR
jgi:hypothetical protein